MNWRVYYGDGTISNSDNGAVEDTPALDIQVILQYDPVRGWSMQSGGDYYVYRNGDGLWQGVDNMGLWDYLQTDGWKRVLFGRTIRSDDYHRIYQGAVQDRDELKAG